MADTMLENLQRTALAAELVRRNVRNNIITLMTGASEYVVRRLTRELRGTAPQGGPLPSHQSAMRTRTDAAHASIFVNAYVAYAGDNPKRPLTADTFLNAYDLYCALVRPLGPSAVLNINTCWVLARAYRSDQIALERCRRCGTRRVTHPECPATWYCPVCESNCRCEPASAEARQRHAVTPHVPSRPPPAPRRSLRSRPRRSSVGREQHVG